MIYKGLVVAQPTGDWAEKLRVLSSSSVADNNCKGVLVGVQPQAVLQQGTEPPNPQVGHCSELETHSGVHPVISPMQLG